MTWSERVHTTYIRCVESTARLGIELLWQFDSFITKLWINCVKGESEKRLALKLADANVNPTDIYHSVKLKQVKNKVKANRHRQFHGKSEQWTSCIEPFSFTLPEYFSNSVADVLCMSPFCFFNVMPQSNTTNSQHEQIFPILTLLPAFPSDPVGPWSPLGPLKTHTIM